jgi:hypothetical protein
MGLDMYLSARRYVSGWESDYFNSQASATRSQEDVELFDSILDSFDISRSDISDELPSATVSIQVAYWRKANAIHQWFVENVQGGEDDCATYRVDRKQLGELTQALSEVMGLRNAGDDVDITAEDILPTAGGFFFGGTEYDDYYFEQAERTFVMLSKLLENPKLDEFDFEYNSSW